MSFIKKISKLFSSKSSKESSEKKVGSNSKSSGKKNSQRKKGGYKKHEEGRERSGNTHSDHKRSNRNRPDRRRSDRRDDSDDHGSRRGRNFEKKNFDKNKSSRNRSRFHTKDPSSVAETPKPVKPAYKGKPFSEMGLHPKLVEKLAHLKFEHTTKVQETSIPETISGKNIFCSSETGSGKTFSFLLPMLHKFYNNEINQALIICPTREIAIQIQKNILLLAEEDVTSALVIGGTDMTQQKKDLAKYPQILVATPGRLLDMLTTGFIWLEYTEYVVLDEADRMLDMGFEPDLIKIHEELTGKHQTVLFSATLFPQVKKIAAKYANDFKEIVIGNPTRVANTVTHLLVQLKPEEKDEALRYLMTKSRGKMIVFFNTINATSKYSRKMSRVRGCRVDAIHSKIDQANRQSTIEEFRSNETNVLMASDVASRGIDVPNVDLVVNFDLPNNSEEYIHRVGRTGRAGQTGMAISFYTYKDKKKLEDIEKLIKGKVKRIQNYRDAL